MEATARPQPKQTVPKAPIWTRDFSLLVFGALMQGVAFYFLLPALPLYIVGPLQADERMVGLVIGAFSVTAVIARPFSGYLLDRYGRRPVQLLAAALFCLTMFGYLLGDHLAGLIAVRLLHGLSWGVVSVASATVVADLVTPARRGAGMSQFGLSIPLSLAAGPLLGALVLAGTHFHRLFVGCGLLAALAWASFVLVRHPPVAGRPLRLTFDRLVERRVLRLAIYMFVLCIGYGEFAAFIPLHARNIGMASAAPIYSCYAAGALVTRLFGGSWYDHRGPFGPSLLGVGMLVLGWLLMAWSTVATVLLGALALGLGFGTTVPSFQAMAMDLVEEDRRGAANGTIFSSYDVGITVGAIGFGQLAPHTGLVPTFLASAGLTVVAGLLFVIWVYPAFRRHRLPLGPPLPEGPR